jgi:hypothetical protein
MNAIVKVKAFIEKDEMSEVVESIFSEGEPIVRRKTSLGKRSVQYTETSMIHELLTNTKPQVWLQYAAYYPDTQGALYEDCYQVRNANEETVGYEQQGWGLIELTFDFDDERRFKDSGALAVRCVLSIFTEKEASVSKKFDPHLVPPKKWNWNRVYHHGRRIESTLNRLFKPE